MDVAEARNRKTFGLLIEQAAPLFTSVVTMFVLVALRDGVVHRFAPGGWKAEGLYSAVFNWAAIQTGFAFGVYGFVLAKSEGFVGALSATVAMKRFIGYVKSANIAGFILTIFSIPLLIVNPNLAAPSHSTYGFVALWFSLFVWAFMSFLRIAYTFGRLTNVPDSKPFHGAGS